MDKTKKKVFIIFIIFFIIFSVIYKYMGPTHFNNINDETIDYFYFSMSTMASVGYGDITPKTKISKIITIVQQGITIFILTILFT